MNGVTRLGNSRSSESARTPGRSASVGMQSVLDLASPQPLVAQPDFLSRIYQEWDPSHKGHQLVMLPVQVEMSWANVMLSLLLELRLGHWDELMGTLGTERLYWEKALGIVRPQKPRQGEAVRKKILWQRRKIYEQEGEEDTPERKVSEAGVTLRREERSQTTGRRYFFELPGV